MCFRQGQSFPFYLLALLLLQIAKRSLYEEETSGPPMPFSPGWLVAELSMPTLERPESDATGASPGLGAFSADPTPCSRGVVRNKTCLLETSRLTLGLVLEELVAGLLAAGSLGVRHNRLR